MHVVSFMRVATTNLISLTRQSAKKSEWHVNKKYVLAADVHELWKQHFRSLSYRIYSQGHLQTSLHVPADTYTLLASGPESQGVPITRIHLKLGRTFSKFIFRVVYVECRSRPNQCLLHSYPLYFGKAVQSRA